MLQIHAKNLKGNLGRKDMQTLVSTLSAKGGGKNHDACYRWWKRMTDPVFQHEEEARDPWFHEMMERERERSNPYYSMIKKRSRGLFDEIYP